MSVKDDLIAARALIDTPEKWAKNPTGVNPPCAMGAVGVVTGAIGVVPSPKRNVIALTALRRSLPDGFFYVDTYNDEPATTHADIMALFDRAIAAAGDA